MTSSSRTLLTLVAALAVVGASAAAGYGIVHARAGGAEPRQAWAPVAASSPGEPARQVAPAYQRWTVGKVVRPATVYVRPDRQAPVKARLATTTPNGYPTLVLVDTVRSEGNETWYRVWLAIRPNGSRGWIREGDLGFFTTSSKIVIDLSDRQLTVYRRGEQMGSFPVAIGRPGLETPTGYYFVNQKLRPPSPGGPYGVLAIGISAFQPKLAHWPLGGPVAIHGTNEDHLIGKAVSHGCVRMHNKDVLAVDRWVPAGSPVVIRR